MTVSAPVRSGIVTVLAPKGGAGKTAVAVNLSQALAQRGPVVLVDLDLYFGNVEYALRLRPLARLDDLVEVVRASATNDVARFLANYRDGFDVLCSPRGPIEADHLASEAVMSVVDHVIELDRHVVFDTAPGIGEVTLGALERSTHSLLVTCTDVASVQSARKLIGTLRDLRFDEDRLSLVVNRASVSTGLSVDDVEAVLGMSAVAIIPDDERVGESLSMGDPLVPAHVGAQRVFAALAASILGESTPTRSAHDGDRSGRRWWSR